LVQSSLEGLGFQNQSLPGKEKDLPGEWVENASRCARWGKAHRRGREDHRGAAAWD